MFYCFGKKLYRPKKRTCSPLAKEYSTFLGNIQMRLYDVYSQRTDPALQWSIFKNG